MKLVYKRWLEEYNSYQKGKLYNGVLLYNKTILSSLMDYIEDEPRTAWKPLIEDGILPDEQIIEQFIGKHSNEIELKVKALKDETYMMEKQKTWVKGKGTFCEMMELLKQISIEKEKVVVVGFPPKESIGDVVTLQNHMSYWTDKSGKILVELEEEKKVATLKDLLVETYDIFVEGNKYFCVPKFGVIDQDFDYEMRDVSELECEIGQVDGFRARDERGRFVSALGVGDFATTDIMVMASTAAWKPPVLEPGAQFKGSVVIGNQEVKRIESNNSSADT